MKIASVEFIVRNVASGFVFGIEYPVATADEALVRFQRDRQDYPESYQGVEILDTRYHLDLQARQPQN